MAHIRVVRSVYLDTQPEHQLPTMRHGMNTAIRIEIATSGPITAVVHDRRVEASGGRANVVEWRRAWDPSLATYCRWPWASR